VFGKSDQQIQLTSERRRESKVSKIGPWVKGRLLLFDLGYFSYALMDRIHQGDGFFISRLKEGCPQNGGRPPRPGQKSTRLHTRTGALFSQAQDPRYGRRGNLQEAQV